MTSRRAVLRAVAGVAAAGLLARFGPVRAAAPAPAAEDAAGLAAALDATDLIYLTPLRSDGAESRCQAEVWFVADGPDIFVVTATAAWRARAIRAGLPRARIWVGDVGVWTRSDGRYRGLPQAEVEGALVDAAAEQDRVLELFGSKYAFSWILWGPRFRNGLQDGTRVMLRYRPVAA